MQRQIYQFVLGSDWHLPDSVCSNPLGQVNHFCAKHCDLRLHEWHCSPDLVGRSQQGLGIQQGCIHWWHVVEYVGHVLNYHHHLWFAHSPPQNWRAHSEEASTRNTSCHCYNDIDLLVNRSAESCSW